MVQFVNKNQIFLKAKIESLNEIVISKKFEERFLVVNPIRKRNIKSGFGGSEYPFILALYFPYQGKYEFIKNLNSVKIYLKNYWFEENRPSKFRLRILSVGGDGLPDKDLLSESIIVEAVKNQKEVIIDVSEYDLIFSKSGLYIGLEWLYIPFNEYEQVFTVDGEKGRKTMKRFAPRFSLTYEEVNKYKVAVFSNGKWIEEVLPSFNGNEQIVPAISLTLSN